MAVLVVAATTFVLYRNFAKRNNNPFALRRYSNTQANIAFAYPASFGMTRETLLDSQRDNLVSAGSALKITFSTTNDVWLVAASQDFSMFKEDAYVGSERISTSSCPMPGVIDNLGNGCAVRALGQNTALVRTEYLADEGVYNLFRTFSFDVPAEPYRGLKIIQSFPSVYAALNADVTDGERGRLLQQYAQELLSGISSDQKLAAQLKDIDRIAKAISFDRQK